MQIFFEQNPPLCIPRAVPVALDAQGKPGQYTRLENLPTSLFSFALEKKLDVPRTIGLGSNYQPKIVIHGLDPWMTRGG